VLLSWLMPRRMPPGARSRRDAAEATSPAESPAMTGGELRAYAGSGTFLAFCLLAFVLLPDNGLFGLFFIPAVLGLCLVLTAR
jgi:hypothetical protein